MLTISANIVVIRNFFQTVPKNIVKSLSSAEPDK